MIEKNRNVVRRREMRKSAQQRAMVAIAAVGSSDLLALPSWLPDMVIRIEVTSQAMESPRRAIISMHQLHASFAQIPCNSKDVMVSIHVSVERERGSERERKRERLELAQQFDTYLPDSQSQRCKYGD